LIIKLRPIAPTDWPKILAIQTLCYTELTPEPLNVLQSKAELSPNSCFVIEKEQEAIGTQHKIIGYCLAHPWKSNVAIALNQVLTPLDDVDCLYLHDLALLSSARGLRLAEHILQALKDFAKTNQLNKISLVAVQGAEGYWAKQGFIPVENCTSLTSYPSGACYMYYPIYQ
jgi:ribosomal protein S18 acetylase RimI-like enzyme